MPDIDFGRISESLNEKTDRDLRNVDTTAKADAVIDFQLPTAENGYTWYRKYASGWVEQGGQTTTNGTIVLPVAMLDTNYNITMAQAGNTSAYTAQPMNITTTGFGYWQYQGVFNAYWQVSGVSA